MSLRRRLMLSYLATLNTWQEWYVEYIYNTLLPQTINSKEVLNKARVKTIYGNSEVENQLISDVNVAKTLTFETTDTSSKVIDSINVVANHIYLITCEQNIALTSNTRNTFVFQGNYQYSTTNASLNKGLKVWLYTATTTELATLYYLCHSPNTQVSFTNFNVKDLTQRYPFDTPTTLTDNRVQAIINRGYIPFNSGKIKSVDMEEISSEPYNLFDGELEIGSYSNTGQVQGGTTAFRSNKNTPIEVVGGQTYTLEIDNAGTNTVSSYQLFEYDLNGNFIQRDVVYSNNYQFTLTNTTKYIKFACFTGVENASLTGVQICFHRTGTRTGYATHKSFSPITFKYQGGGVGTSHDTLDRTDTEWVFTKDRKQYTFNGTENVKLWQANASQTAFYWVAQSTLGFLNSSQNYVCDKLRNNVYNDIKTGAIGIGCSGNNLAFGLSTTDLPTQTAEAFKTWLANNPTTIEYQLATPQVIRIPRKHLGIKRISECNIVRNLYGSIYLFDINDLQGTIVNGVVGNTPNIYTLQFLSKELASSRATTYSQDKSISVYTNGLVEIRSDDCSTTTDFINKYGDYYIFYETQDEVADIDFEIDIEAGGSVNTDSEVLPNVKFGVKCKR